jgi:hypothetical protein
MAPPALAVVLLEQQEMVRWKGMRGGQPYQLIRGCCGRQLQLVDTYCQLFRASCSLLDDWHKVLGFGRAWEACRGQAQQQQEQQQQQQQEEAGEQPAWHSQLQDLLLAQPLGALAQESEGLLAAARSVLGPSKGASRAKKAGVKQRSSGGAAAAAAGQGEQRAAVAYWGLPAEDVLLLASLVQLLMAVSASLSALSSRLEVDVAWLMNEEVSGAGTELGEQLGG